MKETRLTGEDAWETAKRKNKYGCYDWIGWIDSTGEKNADVASYENIKEAMLETGTQGYFREFARGVSWMTTWRMGSRMLWLDKRGLR